MHISSAVKAELDSFSPGVFEFERERPIKTKVKLITFISTLIHYLKGFAIAFLLIIARDKIKQVYKE